MVTKDVKAELDGIKESILQTNESIKLLTQTVNRRCDTVEVELKKIDERAILIESSVNGLDELVQQQGTEIVELKKIQGATSIKLIDEVKRLDGNTQVLEQSDKNRALELKNLSESYKNHNETVANLKDKIVLLEQTVHSNLQHKRLNNIEIDGIPTNIGEKSDQLEEAALKIFEAINVTVLSGDIQAIHRLPAKEGSIKPTIIQFVSRKTVSDIFENRKKLKNLSSLNIEIAGLTNTSKIFIRPSLCPYYRKMAYNCRELKRNGLIKEVFTSDEGIIKIKISSESDYIKVQHELTLLKYFPYFEGFSF